MGRYSVLREREDGDFDHVMIESDGTETVIEIIAPAAENRPWVNISDEEQAEMTRSLRDDYLAQTDWWASSDLTMTAAQTAYRQALRDITSHANWPFLNDDDWPTKP